MDVLIKILERIPLARRVVGLLFQRHLHQRASVGLVADELDYNARQVGNDRSPTSKHRYVQFGRWEAYERDIHLRLRRDPELWTEVAAAYAALRDMERGAESPAAEWLRAVAERLRATLN